MSSANNAFYARNRFDLEDVQVSEEVKTETILTLTSHESRRKFCDQQVGTDVETAILTSARSAPSSSNLQAYSIIVVRDAERRARLAELVGDQESVRQAPLVMVFCADISRLRYVCQRQGHPFAADTLEMFLLASIDAALCMQNALVASESLGLGAVPIGSVRNHPEQIAKELGLPEGVFAVVGLAVGYAVGEGRGVKSRLPSQLTVHEERYSSDGLDAALDEYDSTMISRAVYTGRRVSLGVDQVDPFDGDDRYGWSEHTARRCSNTLGLGPASLRERLKQEVKQRGFLLR